MSFVIIPRGEGVVTHSEVDVNMMILPEDAEIYEDRDEFENRLDDFDTS